MGTFVPKMDTTLKNSTLEGLFPRARQAILRVLYGHPDRAFYLREIGERAGISLSQLQRELKRLTGAGAIRRFEEGRHVYFQADPTSPIFEELRSIVKKTFGVVGVLRLALLPYSERIEIAFIYGSMAHGDESRESDVDLMVIGNAGFREIAGNIKLAEAELGREVNVTSYPVAEFVQKLEARHHFLSSVLNNERLFVLGVESDLRALLDQQVD